MEVKVTGDFSRVNEEERDFINERLDRFNEKFEGSFSDVHVKLDCHPEKETSKGRKKYSCKIGVNTDHGRYNASGDDFGVEKTISGTLAKIEKQIRK